jgi:hypothetical protein
MVMMIFMLVLLIPILAIVLDSPVGRALAGRLERRGLSAGGEDVTAERLSYLEGEVDRLTTEVRKLEEESQFLNKLLTERPDTRALPPGEQASPPGAESHPTDEQGR